MACGVLLVATEAYCVTSTGFEFNGGIFIPRIRPEPLRKTSSKIILWLVVDRIILPRKLPRPRASFSIAFVIENKFNHKSGTKRTSVSVMGNEEPLLFTTVPL